MQSPANEQFAIQSGPLEGMRGVIAGSEEDGCVLLKLDIPGVFVRLPEGAIRSCQPRRLQYA